MTFTIKSEKIKGYNELYSITIEQDKFSPCYRVTKNRMINDYMAIEEKSGIYPTLEKAKARYNALKREIRKELD